MKDIQQPDSHTATYPSSLSRCYRMEICLLGPACVRGPHVCCKCV